MTHAPIPPAQGVGALLLAGGLGRRMGLDFDESKLLLTLGDKPIICHAVDAIQQAGIPLAVVLGHGAQRIAAVLQGRDLHLIRAQDHARGIAHALRAGLSHMDAPWARHWQAVMVCLGDMPYMSGDFLRLLTHQVRGSHSIIVPEYAGQNRNPVIWGRDYFPQLIRLQNDEGGRVLFSAHADQIIRVPGPYAQMFEDIDTPDDLARMRGQHHP